MAARPLFAAGETVDYERTIKPIFKARCFACHGALKQESGLRLDTGTLIRKGGDSGAVVVAGNVNDSPLIERITATDESERMPPEGKPLTAQQIRLIRAWIAQGTMSPQNEQPAEDLRKHWAFQAPRRPAVPRVKNTAWIRNPLDAFIAAEHEQQSLQPSPPADKHVLLRRVYLDLIGLPPTRSELHAFLSDESANVYEKVVDRSLDSPQYGERWGRHWMDVWRYSDWYGRRKSGDVRNSYPHIWRWRDWIVESLNADKGYDQMVREMLAADEIHPEDDHSVVATGYLIRSWYKLNYNTWMRDLVEHTGKAFLGLTLNCAMCHDHKYDPITQEEYFKFRAFFEPLELRQDRVPGLPDPGPYTGYQYGSSLKPIPAGLVRVYDKNLSAETYMFILGDERNRFPDRPPVDPGVPSFLVSQPLPIQTIELPRVAWSPGTKAFVREETLSKARHLIARARSALHAATDEIRELRQRELAAAEANLRWGLARIAADRAKVSEATSEERQRLAQRASETEREWKLRTAEAELIQRQHEWAKFKSQASPEAKMAEPEQQVKQAQQDVAAARQARSKASIEFTSLGPVYPKHSTGRRRALANWIAAADNPLTARVAVNHMWMRHFGSPLVSSVSDFGRNGKPPSHPKLLDWLAVELVENGWSMKHLHRLIVTSNTYRMQSTSRKSRRHPASAVTLKAGRTAPPADVAHSVPATLQNAKIDPENVSLWHMPPRRMEAEVVRDSLLYVAGQLDPLIGGQEIDFKQGPTIPRRSIYFAHHDEGRMTVLNLFDAPDPCDCYRRTETVVPQQALALANSQMVRNLSRLLARRLAAHSSADEAFIEAAFEQILTRPASVTEKHVCRNFLKQQIEVYSSIQLKQSTAKRAVQASAALEMRAKESLVHALLNHNDFVTVR